MLGQGWGCAESSSVGFALTGLEGDLNICIFCLAMKDAYEYNKAHMNNAALVLSGIVSSLVLTLPLMGDSINSPENYPKDYQNFLSALRKQSESNPYDFSGAANVVYKATQDELAMSLWMQQAAKEGVAPAIYYVANQRRLVLYMTEPNKDTAKEAQEIHALYKKAADLGFIPAVVHKAGNLVEGAGVAKDRERAIRLLAQASRGGDKHARLRWLQLTGRLMSEKDFTRKEVQSEVTRGNDQIIYEMARLSPTLEKSLPYLIKAAELGNGNAYAEISRLLSAKKPDESFTYAIKGAQVFNPECMGTIGYCMIDPEFQKMGKTKVSIPYDPSRGMYLLKMGAMLHSPYAHMLMGRLYHHGLFGTAKDPKRAFEHYRQATMRQDPMAQLAYSYYLLKGIGTEANPKEAMRHLNYLAHKSNMNAIAMIAYVHAKGIGVKKSIKNAEKLLNELAIAYPIAYIYLADLKSKEKDEKKPDESIIKHYLRLAALAMPEKDAKELFDKIQTEGDWVFDL